MTPHPEKEIHPYLLLAQWTPRDHGLVMVQDYDIYYITSPKSNTGYRVTDTAIPGILSNGLPDWLYEGKIIKIIYILDKYFTKFLYINFYKFCRRNFAPCRSYLDVIRWPHDVICFFQ